MEAPIAQFVAPNRSFFNVFFKQAFSYSTQKTQAFFQSDTKDTKKHKHFFNLTQKTQAFFNSFHPREKNTGTFLQLVHKHTISFSMCCARDQKENQALFATGQKTTSTFLHRNINTPSVFLYVAPETKTKSSTFCNWSEITHTFLHPIIKTHICSTAPASTWSEITSPKQKHTISFPQALFAPGQKIASMFLMLLHPRPTTYWHFFAFGQKHTHFSWGHAE